MAKVEQLSAADRDKLVAEVNEAIQTYSTNITAAMWRYVNDGTPVDYDAPGGSFFSFPMLLVVGPTEGGAGNKISLVDRTEMDGQLCPQYTRYKKEGWGGQVNIDTLNISIVTSEDAVVETKGRRFKTDESVLNRWEGCYWMRRRNGAWKAIAVLITEPPLPSIQAWMAWISNIL